MEIVKETNNTVTMQSLCDKILTLQLTVDFLSFGKHNKTEYRKLIKEINHRKQLIAVDLLVAKKLLAKYCLLFDELQSYGSVIKVQIKKLDEIDESIQDHSLNSLVLSNSPRTDTPDLEVSVAFSDFTPTITYQNKYKGNITRKYLTFGIAPLSSEEFTSVPKYMVGRLTLEVVNNFIQVVSEALVKKYELLSKPLHTIKTTEAQLYRQYKQQQTGTFKGKQFVTEDDIARQFNRPSLDKKALNFLTILRHTKRLVRANLLGKCVYYV